jgi:hypothetical protein
VPLELGDRPVPLETFNLPPLAAAEAAVLLPLGITPAGVAWQAIAAASVGFAAVSVPRLARSSWSWAVVLGGLGLGAYMLVDHVVIPDEQSYWWGLVLGTNNYLVLGMVAAFALALHARRSRTAGILLGLAVATKLWPATLAALVIRERRWPVLGWAAGTAVVQGIVWLAWLGPGAVTPGIDALGAADQEPTGVIGVAALLDLVDWLPSWTGWAILAVLVAIPVSGAVGIGLGILAGLAPITNLWGHYLPTVLFGIALVAVGLTAWARGPAPRATEGPRASA